MDRSDRPKSAPEWTFRDGGITAYLQGPDSLNPAFTRLDGAGSTKKLAICNAHNDFHISLRLPSIPTANDDGIYPYRYVHRLVSIPPEVSNRLWNEGLSSNREERGSS